MEILQSKFTFYKAGQGAFYGGQIQSLENSQAWNIVFDCGASKRVKGNLRSLRAEISRFKYDQFTEVKEIDVLFISHFDYDHVSGLKSLFSAYKVKQIVIPYIPVNQRQFSLISGSGTDTDDGGMSYDDFAGLIENPVQFFATESEGAEVIVVLPEDGERYFNNAEDGNPDGVIDEGKISISLGGTPVDEIPDELNEELKEIDAKTYKVFKSDCHFLIRQYWEFSVFAQKVSDEVLKQFITGLKAIAGLNDADELDLDKLKELLIEHRPKAKEWYKDKLKGINSHGLVLLHGPINQKQTEVSNDIDSTIPLNTGFLDRYNLWYHHKILGGKNFGATLLMGDTSLNPNSNEVESTKIDLPNWLLSKLHRVYVFQVPHHGSDKNWDYAEYMGLFKRKFTFIPWIINVCNFGFGNDYGHPHPEVIDNLKPNIVFNTQYSAFITRLTVFFD